MIIQACLNGARAAGYHPHLPLTPAEMVRDALACVQAGAAELHLHPRGPNRCESLAAVDDTVRMVRGACPGTLIGVSTGAWIEGSTQATRDCIAAWRVRPDYASVNLSEPDAPGVIGVLQGNGVGVEAGLATVEDARRLAALSNACRVFRILIEIDDQDLTTADRIADGILAVLTEANLSRPILLHGSDATVWHFVRRAANHRFSTRVGLEDGRDLATGGRAFGNAALVEDAVKIYRGNPG